MIPLPRQSESNAGNAVLSAASHISVGDDRLLGLARQFAFELKPFTTLDVPVTSGTAGTGTVSLCLDTALDGGVYTLDITDSILVKGGSVPAVAHATTTLLHTMHAGHGRAAWHGVHLQDRPEYPYRGLMVDLARQPHSYESLRMFVALCRWYKLSHLHLHLTDNQSFTFPSTEYPELATPGHSYSLEQLRELEEYAACCGVTLLPELDVPGHCRYLLGALGEQVGCAGPGGGSDICPGRESTYEVMETLIAEMCDVFCRTEYFHIGADETRRSAWKECPYCAARMQEEGLADEEELYRYFIIRLHEMVVRQGKKTLVWEGFGPGGRLRVPRDVGVMVFESDYNIAPDLLADGYPVINTSWQPLYVAGRGRGPGLSWPAAAIHQWNVGRWESPWQRSRAFREPIQLEDASAVLGAQVCSWGQSEAAELPSLRDRVAAMSERAWNPGRNDAGDFFLRLGESDLKLGRFLYSALPQETWPRWITTPVEELDV